MSVTKKRINQLLQKYLSEERTNHVFRVEKVALRLAEKWDVPEYLASTAALLHDVAKEIKINTIKQTISDDLLRIYQEYPPIFHAFLGPVVVKNELNISNSDILNAIKWHTTGRKEMTLLEKIIFVSDYIEPHRKYKGRDYIESLAFEDIDQATFAVSFSALLRLRERHGKIHPDSIKCYDYYGRKIGVKNQEKIISMIKSHE